MRIGIITTIVTLTISISISAQETFTSGYAIGTGSELYEIHYETTGEKTVKITGTSMDNIHNLVYLPDTVTHNGTTYKITEINGLGDAENNIKITINTYWKLPKYLENIDLSNGNIYINQGTTIFCYAENVPELKLKSSVINEIKGTVTLIARKNISNDYKYATTWKDILEKTEDSETEYEDEATGITYTLTRSDKNYQDIRNNYLTLNSITPECTTNLEIPKTIKTSGSTYYINIISEGAFESNRYLKSVTIPYYVTEIGDKAFKDCTQLETITINRSTPPQISNETFSGISTEATLEVPTGAEEKYKNDEKWGKIIYQTTKTTENDISRTVTASYDLRGNRLNDRETINNTVIINRRNDGGVEKVIKRQR